MVQAVFVSGSHAAVDQSPTLQLDNGGQTHLDISQRLFPHPLCTIGRAVGLARPRTMLCCKAARGGPYRRPIAARGGLHGRHRRDGRSRRRRRLPEASPRLATTPRSNRHAPVRSVALRTSDVPPYARRRLQIAHSNAGQKRLFARRNQLETSSLHTQADPSPTTTLSNSLSSLNPVRRPRALDVRRCLRPYPYLSFPASRCG